MQEVRRSGVPQKRKTRRLAEKTIVRFRKRFEWRRG